LTSEEEENDRVEMVFYRIVTVSGKSPATVSDKKNTF
jgi:hypothetical protein